MRPINGYSRKRCESIPSYGLIPFCRVNTCDYEDDILFLIQQRRDTFEYVEFLMGLYENESDTIKLFSKMTDDERDRFRNYLFMELWDDMWVDKTARMYRDGLSRATKKYESICDSIDYFLNITLSTVREPPWGFPKGRKNMYTEKDTDCAIRETEEETKIPKSIYKIYPNYKFSERFQGSNGKFYSTRYFLCEFEEPLMPNRMDTPQCIRKTSASEEVGKIVWLPYKEAVLYLDPRRQSMLYEAYKVIKQDLNKK